MAHTRRTTSLVPVAATQLGQYAPPTARASRLNAAVAYVSSLADGSRSSQSSAVRKLAHLVAGDVSPEHVPWGELRYEHTQALRAKLVATYAPSTANRHLSALRGVLRQAWRLGQMGAEDYQRAVDLKPARGHREPVGRALDEAEVGKLFKEAAERRDALGRRDAAILALFFGGGLRLSEVTRARSERYDPDRSTLLVLGKGNKERLVYLADDACALINAWLKVRGKGDGPMFPRFSRWGVLKDGLSPSGVALIVCKHRDAAHLKAMSSHDFRRTYISDAIDRTGDLTAIANQVGHANVATTAKYDRRGDRAKKRVASTVRIPKG